MDGYKAFQYYMAVRLHFTKDSFDVFKNGRVKGSSETFNKRNDKLLFEKLAKKHPQDGELIQFYVANFAYGNANVIYEEEESISYYREWVKRKESITKIFTDDMNKIIRYAENNKLSKNDVLDFTFGTPPCILTQYIGNHISVESVRILDDYLNIIDSWKNTYFTTAFWDNDIRRISKLKKFVKYDKNRIDPIVSSFVEELNDL